VDFFKAIEHVCCGWHTLQNNTPITTLTKVIILGGTASKKPESINLFIEGQALRGNLMKGEGGRMWVMSLFVSLVIYNLFNTPL
jgi:hypothetical protein